MKRQLLLVVALAVLGIATLAASAIAGSVQIGAGGANVSINLPGGSDLAPLGNLPACSNLKDDDGDGKTDLLDPGCSSPGDTDETDPAAPPTTTTGSTSTGSTSTGSTSTNNGGSTSTGSTSTGSTSTSTTTTTQGGTTGSTGNGGQGHGGNSFDTKDVKPGNEFKTEDKDVEANREPMQEQPTRTPDGKPTPTNPTATISDFGPAPVGVPNFVIDQFSIPPFLLPIYQSCGTEYGIPWEVLASINRIETAFGTNLNVSTAGALGWMQFIPSTWKAYGVDANNDGKKDPYNPVDAICAAARYLKAAGGDKDISSAIFSYNHADWYVDEVLLYAKQYGHIPDGVLGSLTGLTEGARFPVAAKSSYADDISEREAAKRAKTGAKVAGNAADVVSSSPTRRGIDIFSRAGAPVIAVNDGTISKVGKSKKLGNYVVLQDSYGNRFTYAQLGSVAKVYPVPQRDKLTPNDFKIVNSKGDTVPNGAASRSSKKAVEQAESDSSAKKKGKASVSSEIKKTIKKINPAAAKAAAKAAKAKAPAQPVDTEDSRDRLFANPDRKNNAGQADVSGQLDSALGDNAKGYENFKPFVNGILRYDPKTMDTAELKKGSKVIAGTVLGKVGASPKAKGATTVLAPHLNFAIRPAGRGAPKIDPKPILDGWKLLEATAIYRAAGKNPFADTTASIGQILLASKDQLSREVLSNPKLDIYACGRNDIATGQIDRRILALLQYLTARGYSLTITSLKCGHSFLTTSGNQSEHTTGTAVDIATINGVPVIGNQGPGTLAESLVKDVLQLQGTMAPHQVISLMNFGGPSFALPDHDDHVHVGYSPSGPTPAASDGQQQFAQILKPDQWRRLIARIGDIDNPTVSRKPSEASLPAGKAGKNSSGRASSAHLGE
ncbi:hypothetical protein BH10ACT11_BH10ACT11_06190 [soil metagenome]